MADEMYDADGDVSRFLQSPGPDSHLLAVPEPEAPHVGLIQDASAAPQLQAHPAPEMPSPAPAFVFQAPPINAEHQQAPAVGVEHQQAPASGLQAPAVSVEHQQAPATINVEHHQQAAAMDVDPPQMVAPEKQPAYGVPGPSLLQGGGVDDDNLSWFEEMLESGFVSPSLYEQFINDGEQEVAAIVGNMEDGEDVGGAEAGLGMSPAEEDVIFMPFARGELDCARCRVVREVLHESENYKIHFIVHGADPGQFQHAIIERMRVGADGETQTEELLYFDLRMRTHEWVHNFIANCVQMMNSDNSGQPQDICSSFCAAASTNTNAPRPSNNAHNELELDMLRSILSAPAANVEEAEADAPETSKPVMQAEENTNHAGDAFDAPFDWAGFKPEILESSHCTPYDPESGINPLLYPSLIEKMREREQARLSTLSVNDATEYFKKYKEDTAKELDLLSSVSFKLLCRKDSTYRMHSRRIHGINRKVTKLEQTARYLSSSGLFVVKQKMEMYKHEKALLYAEIKKGLKDDEKGSNGAGPSGTK